MCRVPPVQARPDWTRPVEFDIEVHAVPCDSVCQIAMNKNTAVKKNGCDFGALDLWSLRSHNTEMRTKQNIRARAKRRIRRSPYLSKSLNAHRPAHILGG